jgi:hypothetical protein
VDKWINWVKPGLERTYILLFTLSPRTSLAHSTFPVPFLMGGGKVHLITVVDPLGELGMQAIGILLDILSSSRKLTITGVLNGTRGHHHGLYTISHLASTVSEVLKWETDLSTSSVKLDINNGWSLTLMLMIVRRGKGGTGC